MDAPSRGRPSDRAHRWSNLRRLAGRLWPTLRFVVGLALAWWAFSTINGHSGELSDAWATLGRLHWSWVAVAFVAEAASFAAFAMVQLRLLEAGSLRPSLRSMSAITLASNSVANSLPLGPALAAVYAFRQYRRVGADDALSGWTVVATFVFTSVSLAVVAALGLGIAGSVGAGFDLVWITVGVLAAAVVVAVVFLHESLMARAVSAALRTSRRTTGYPRGELGAQIDRITRRFTAVHLDRRGALDVGGWSLANWAFDCTCLALSFAAVGAPVPWRALLLAYGAGQLAANLPITPGGLGVVEGSLIIGLVVFGGAEAPTVAAVLLYRIFQFWIPLPVGWVIWGRRAWKARRRSTAGPGPDAMSPVVAGVVPARKVDIEAGRPNLEAGPVRPLPTAGRRLGWEDRSWRRPLTSHGDRAGGQPRRTTWRRRCNWGVVGALIGAGVTLGACTSGHDSLGTGSTPCYLVLARAQSAVHDRGHLAGVRLVPASALKSHPHLRAVLVDRAGGPVGNVCLVAYSGNFTATSVDRPAMAPSGRYAVVVVTTPGRRLLVTFVLARLPIRFSHQMIGP